MIDGTTLARIELLHPKLREEAKAIYTEICQLYTGTKFCRFTHTLRTFKEQEELYAIGRTKPGKRVTNSRSGASYHNYGMAIDVAMIDGKTADFNTPKEIVAIFDKYGWTWGGRFKSIRDIPHFQKELGYKIGDLMAKYLKRDFIDGTNYVNL